MKVYMTEYKTDGITSFITQQHEPHLPQYKVGDNYSINIYNEDMSVTELYETIVEIRQWIEVLDEHYHVFAF